MFDDAKDWGCYTSADSMFTGSAVRPHHDQRVGYAAGIARRQAMH
jgi:hypothetical protein